MSIFVAPFDVIHESQVEASASGSGGGRIRQ
jgi:hypothetical protein